MWPLLTSVFVASALGSAHCVGMCGPLLLFAMRDPNERGSRLALAYHGGRLGSYMLLGLGAGVLGGTLNLGGALLGFQRVALAASAVFLILFGIHVWAKSKGFSPFVRSRKPGPISRAYLGLQKKVSGLPALRRSLGLGLLSSFLPCGWLYAFAVVAAGTASPWLGALVMAAFWAGGLPLLAAFGAGSRRVLRPIEKHIPALTAVLMIGSGLFVLYGRVSVTVPPLAQAASDQNPLQEVQKAAEEDPSCCSDQ